VPASLSKIPSKRFDSSLGGDMKSSFWSVAVRARTTLLCAAWLALLAPAPADARDWNVVLNGKAIHIGANRDWNEDNWGLGLEREFDTQSP